MILFGKKTTETRQAQTRENKWENFWQEAEEEMMGSYRSDEKKTDEKL